jgi:hypothetical protein
MCTPRVIDLTPRKFLTEKKRAFCDDVYSKSIPTSSRLIKLSTVFRDKTINDKLFNNVVEDDDLTTKMVSYPLIETKYNYEERIEIYNEIKDVVLNAPKKEIEWIEIPSNDVGIVLNSEYLRITEIYENNQLYLKKMLKKYKKGKTFENIVETINSLENWYLSITVEKPKSRAKDILSEWEIPVRFKIDRNYSINCDKDLIKYLCIKIDSASLFNLRKLILKA